MVDTLIETWHGLQQAGPYIVAILAATTTLAHVLQGAARALERWALGTAATWDDAPATAIRRGAEALVNGLRWVSALMPRVGLGRVPRREPAKEASDAK